MSISSVNAKVYIPYGAYNFSGKPRTDGLKCELCGSLSPAVKCEQCEQHLFCASCDDMFHRHPKRQTHLRRVLNKINFH